MAVSMPQLLTACHIPRPIFGFPWLPGAFSPPGGKMKICPVIPDKEPGKSGLKQMDA